MAVVYIFCFHVTLIQTEYMVIYYQDQTSLFIFFFTFPETFPEVDSSPFHAVKNEMNSSKNFHFLSNFFSFTHSPFPPNVFFWTKPQGILHALKTTEVISEEEYRVLVTYRHIWIVWGEQLTGFSNPPTTAVLVGRVRSLPCLEYCRPFIEVSRWQQTGDQSDRMVNSMMILKKNWLK